VLPPHQYATGTGIINTARQVGTVIGVAALVSVLGGGLTAADYRTGWWLMAAAGAVAALAAPLLRVPRLPAAAAASGSQPTAVGGSQPEVAGGTSR
jgi:hypothetical protein